MPISKKDALEKIKQFVLKEQLSSLEIYFSYAEILDVLPDGFFYQTGEEDIRHDHWYIKVPQPDLPAQTGGQSRYWAISKNTGRVRSICTIEE